MARCTVAMFRSSSYNNWDTAIRRVLLCAYEAVARKKLNGNQSARRSAFHSVEFPNPLFERPDEKKAGSSYGLLGKVADYGFGRRCFWDRK